MGLYVLRFNEKNGILRCKHKEKENAIKLLKSIKKISSNMVYIETTASSGTIKALVKKTKNNV
jgi:RNase P/RNase MRP subunit POP5